MEYCRYRGCLENRQCPYLGTCPQASGVYSITFLPDWECRERLRRIYPRQKRLRAIKLGKLELSEYDPVLSWANGKVAERHRITFPSCPQRLPGGHCLGVLLDCSRSHRTLMHLGSFGTRSVRTG